MLILDVHTGQIRHVSAHAGAVLGVLPAQAVGKTLWDLAVSAEVENPAGLMSQIQEHGEAKAKMVLSTPQGQLHLTLELTLIRVENTPPLLAVQLTPEAAAHADPWVRAVAEHSPDLHYEWDTQSKTARFLNPHALLGYTSEDMEKATHILTQVHPEDEDRGRRAWEDLMAAAPGTLVTSEYRLKNRSGGWDWVQNRRRVVKLDGQGKPRTVLATLSVITPHKEAQERLAASEERYRLLAQHSSDVILRLTPSQEIVYASEASERVMGYEPAALVGRDILMLLHPQDRERVKKNAKKLAAHSNTFTVEGRIIHRLDRTVWMEASCSVERHPATGKVSNIIAVVRDVSARKEMEAKLRQADRTQALGALASGVAHEINNPLTYVLANVEFASDALRLLGESLANRPELLPSISEAQSALLDAVGGAERVRRVVHELRLYGLPDTRGRQVHLLDDLLERAVLLAGSHVRNLAGLEVLKRSQGARVFTDGAAAVQALVNLLMYAGRTVKAGVDGASKVTLTSLGDPSGGYPNVEVCYTGASHGPKVPLDLAGEGMTPDDEAPLGDPMDLALFVAHAAAAAAGGTLTHEHAKDGGGALTLALPAE